MLRGIKIIAGDGIGGEGVGLGPVFGKLLQGVALFGIEHLVFQIMGNAGGRVQPPAVQPEAQVHAAVAGGKKGIFTGVAGLADDADRQTVGQGVPHHCLPHPGVMLFVHSASSFPFRKYTVSSAMVRAASCTRWGVTAVMASIIS